MAHIEFKEVSIAFPIFNAESRSLKNKVISLSTGGRLGLDAKGVTEIRALDQINFTFENAERIGLIGHNGSGKSTLLRALSGVYAPQRGSIRIKGETTSLIDISLGINPEFTGRENILIRGSLLGLTRQQINDRTDEIIAFTELGEFIDMPLRTYSSGMQLRLAFAVSTTIEPEILLMDEWLAVGDENNISALPASSEIVASYIKKLSGHLKSSSIKIAVASIAALHNLNSLQDPTQTPDVKIEMRRMYRTLGRYAKQAYGINKPLLNKMVAATDDSLRGIRDRAILLVAYDSLCRRSELVSLEFEDISIE